MFVQRELLILLAASIFHFYHECIDASSVCPLDGMLGHGETSACKSRYVRTAVSLCSNGRGIGIALVAQVSRIEQLVTIATKLGKKDGPIPNAFWIGDFRGKSDERVKPVMHASLC
jgi:hypothetical protein